MSDCNKCTFSSVNPVSSGSDSKSRGSSAGSGTKTSKELVGVVSIHSKSDFKKAIQASARVVVDFYTTWCGPCKRLAPYYEAEAVKQKSCLLCLKVDAEEMEALAAEFEVESYPTILFFRNGKIVQKLSTGDPNALVKAMKALASAK